MDIPVVKNKVLYLLFFCVLSNLASSQIEYWISYQNQLFKVTDDVAFTHDFGYLNWGDTVQGKILMINRSGDVATIKGMYSGDEDLTIAGCPNTKPKPNDTTYTNFFFCHRGQRLQLAAFLYFQYEGMTTRAIRFTAQLLPEDLMLHPGIFRVPFGKRKDVQKISFTLENKSDHVLNYSWGKTGLPKWKSGNIKKGEKKKIKLKVPVLADENRHLVFMKLDYQSLCCGQQAYILQLPITYLP